MKYLVFDMSVKISWTSTMTILQRLVSNAPTSLNKGVKMMMMTVH